MLDTLIETLTAFTDRQTDRQTDKSKDQALKQHHLGSKNNLSDYRRPNYFSRIVWQLIFVITIDFHA